MSVSALYDIPSKASIKRHKILGWAMVAVFSLILLFIIWQFYKTGQFSAKKWSLFLYENVWNRIFEGLLATLGAFAAASVFSIAVGLILSLLRFSDKKTVSLIAAFITEIFRSIPVLILMMLLYYGLPVIDIKMTPYIAVVVALVIYNGSVLAEVFRSGYLSIPLNQYESGYCIGLRKYQIMLKIVLPQTFKNMLPLIIAQMVVILKDTALGFIITYQELLYLAKLYGSQIKFDNPVIPAAIVIGSIYVILCLLLSFLAKKLQKRFAS